MPPKGGNAKKESGRAKKAENEANKKAQAAAATELTEASKWEDSAKKGTKKSDEREEKRAAEIARKAENARLLAAEEASAQAKAPKAPKAGAKKGKPKPAGPGAIAATGGLGEADAEGKTAEKTEEQEAYAATGIDNALDLLEVVTSKVDKASLGQQAAGLEKHPERRFKAAFEAYKERELPSLKVDHPGLRLRQYEEILYKQFQKSPDNPFNQIGVEYNASKEEKLEILNTKKAAIEERLRERL